MCQLGQFARYGDRGSWVWAHEEILLVKECELIGGGKKTAGVKRVRDAVTEGRLGTQRGWKVRLRGLTSSEWGSRVRE